MRKKRSKLNIFVIIEKKKKEEKAKSHVNIYKIYFIFFLRDLPL